MKNMKRYINILAALLILLWVYTAGSKLVELDLFRRQVLTNPIFAPWMRQWVLFLVPGSELFAALLLLFPRTRKAGFMLSLILMIAFTVYIGLILAGVFERLPCSCGGVLKWMRWNSHFIFNLFFTAVAGAGLMLTIKERRLEK